MPKKLESIDPEVLASYGTPTFMDKINALLSGSKHKGAFPMPDHEIGSESPIMHIFITKMLKEFTRNRALQERYGMPPGEFAEMEDYQIPGLGGGATKMFKRGGFDPGGRLDYRKQKSEMLTKEAERKGKPKPHPNYTPIRPWDMREF